VCPGCEDVAVESADTRKLWDANARAWTRLSRAGFDVYRDLVNTIWVPTSLMRAMPGIAFCGRDVPVPGVVL
jgi:hypothetical protein